MNTSYTPDPDLERRLSGRLLDVLIRAGLILAMAVLCYQIFSPFLALMVWALILAVTLYPAHQKLARRMGGKQGLAATVLVLIGLVLIGVPTGLLMFELGDSVHQSCRQRARSHAADSRARAGRCRVADRRQESSLVFGRRLIRICRQWFRVCSRSSATWLKPRWGWLRALAARCCCFWSSFIIAGIIMAFGESGARSTRAIFDRIVGTGRGEEFAKLSTATIRAVALGVLGVAFIQAIVVGLFLLIAGVPFAAVLALIVLVLGIAQVPALLVTLPVIVYIWMSGEYGTGAAVTHSVLLFVAGMLDNVLKPLLLGRGVDAPMVVILLGALGGLASHGLLGMFVGATLLALGYQIFMWWVATNPDKAPARKSQAAI